MVPAVDKFHTDFLEDAGLPLQNPGRLFASILRTPLPGGKEQERLAERKDGGKCDYLRVQSSARVRKGD